MPFKVQGFGTSGKELATALDGIEQDLRALAQLSLTPAEIPKGKAALRERAALLDKQIAVIEKHLNSSDPTTKAQAAELMALAKHERLRLDDGLLAWVMDDVAAAMPKHTAGSPEISTELSVVSALLDGLVSPAEIAHVINVVGPIAGRNVALEALGPTIDASNADAERRAKKTSKENMTVVAKRVTPVMTGFLATSALRSFGAAPALAFLTAALAIRSGVQTGKYLADKEIAKVAISSGMNRLQGETDHDLVRMLERATRGTPLQSAKEVLAAWDKQGTKAEDEGRDRLQPLRHALQQEVELTRYLIERRTQTFEGRTVPATEKVALAALGEYANQLETASKSQNPKQGFEAAAKTLGASLDKTELSQLPSLLSLVPRASRLEATEKAFAGLMHEYGRLMLAVSNPGLHQYLPILEGLGRKPNEGELEYLKQRVGPEPSLGEVLALHKLHTEGRLDLAQLWPPSAQVGLPGNEALKPGSLQNMLDGLGNRDAGARREWWGRMVVYAVPFLGSALGAGVLALFNDPTLAAYVTAIGGAMIGEKVGKVIGNRLSDSGKIARTTSGVELANAFGAEYATSISRFMRKDITAGSKEEVTDRFRKEAGALRTMIEVSTRVHARFAQAVAENPDAANDDKVAREIYAIEGLRTPVLEQLGAFATTLETLSKSTADVATLRKEFAAARSTLLPTIGPVALDVLSTGPEPEVRMGHGIYFMLKTELAKKMLAGTNTETALKGAEEIYLAREAIPRSERPKADALDDWAEMVKKKPARVNDLRMVSKLLSPAYIAKLEGAEFEARHFPSERIAELAQETLNALVSQVYSRFGLFEADRVPELKGVKVERLPGANEGDLSNYRVTAKLSGGGRIELELDAVGRPVPDFQKLKLDLGEDLLTDMARAAAERHLAALEGASTPLGKPKSVVRSDRDETFTATFQADGRSVTVALGLDGSLGPDSIKA